MEMRRQVREFAPTSRSNAQPPLTLRSRLDLSVDVLKHIDTTEDPHLRVHLREQQSIESSAFISASELSDMTKRRWATMCGESSMQEFVDASPDVAAFADVVRAIAAHFTAAPEDLRILHLEDFLEDLAGQTVGDAHVYAYLQHCVLSTSSSM